MNLLAYVRLQLPDTHQRTAPLLLPSSIPVMQPKFNLNRDVELRGSICIRRSSPSRA